MTRLLNAIEAGAAVVTVNDRLARRLRQQFSGHCRAAGLGQWETPSVLPFGGWLNSLYRARADAVFGGAPATGVELLDPSQTELVWANLIRESKAGGDLLQPSAAAEVAADAWRLCHAWRVPMERLTAGTEDSRAFAGWAREYRMLCERENWLDNARLADWLRDQLDYIALSERLVFAGFDEWSPQQTALLDAVEARGAMVERDALPAKPAASARVIEAADADAELVQAARWAAAKLAADPSTRIGVVVPDLQRRREAAIRATTAAIDPATPGPANADGPLPVNVSLGAPLAAAPMVQDALLALDSIGPALEFDALSQLLRSPFIGGAETERTRRAGFDVELRLHGETRLMPSSLNYFADKAECSVWRHYWTAFQHVLADAPRSALPRVWAETFHSALTALGWPGEKTLGSEEYQTLEAFRDLLTDFGRLGLVADAPLGPGEALSRLRRLASRRHFQPRRPEAPIQVLGVLEAAGLDFDAVWVAGLDDTRWPARPGPNPFIPPGVQREFGLPHASAERELGFARAITQRLFGAAPEVVASWPTREGDVALRPSPLLVPFGAAAEEVASEKSVSRISGMDGRFDDRALDWKSQIHQAGRLEILVDDNGPPVASGLASHGGTALLKDQAACPFRAFANHRLRAASPESPLPGLDAGARGGLAHKVMESFWAAVGDQATLIAMDTTTRAAAIAGAVETGLDWLRRRRPATLSPRLRELESARLIALLERWLECETARAPFLVEGREKKATLAIGGLTLNFRIDRIDAIDDGEAVIDYKTGKLSNKAWDGDRPDEPQLPAYALARSGDVTAVLFAGLHREKFGYRGVARDETGIQPMPADAGLAELQIEWRRTLSALARAFHDGDARVDPKKGACDYCDLSPLCRIGEEVSADG